MNKHFQTTGVIIRKTDLNEADRIVTLLTNDRGKIDCIAKGARRIKNKFCGRLDLFCHVNISCFQGRDIAFLNEAYLLNGFTDTKDINKHRLLFYIAELTGRLMQLDHQIDGVYELLIDTLDKLRETDETETLLHSYIIKLLTITGFLPVWNRCSKCNEPLNVKNKIFLSDAVSHVVCGQCACPADGIISIPLVKWVNFMQNYPLSDALKVKTQESDRRYIWLWLRNLIDGIFDRPIKARDFLESCKLQMN